MRLRYWKRNRKKLKNKLTKKGITKKKSEEKGKVKEVLNKAEINFLDCLMKFKGNSFKNFTINFLYEKLKWSESPKLSSVFI